MNSTTQSAYQGTEGNSTLCRNCMEWTDDAWGICADCRSLGYVNSREPVISTRELSFSDMTTSWLLSRLEELNEETQPWSLEIHCEMDSIERELEEREEYEATIRARW